MNVFTVDVDWAPEAVIADTLELFARYGVRCTLFATHASAAIHDAARHVEIGIHPDFNPLLAGVAGEPARVVDDLLSEYPSARGVRSHSMMQSTPLLDLFGSRGLVYDANHFLPYWDDIRPFRLWNGLWRIPYNWEDDIHFCYRRSFASTGLSPASPLNVLDFHPVHVFLNTDTRERYDAARPHYHDADALLGLRNTGGPGARTLLIELLAAQRESVTLGELVARQAAVEPA